MKSTRNLIAATVVSLLPLIVAPGTALADAAAPSSMARKVLHVDGMVGDSCPVLITSALKRVEGVTHVEASFPTHSATVEYDPQRVSLDQIRRTIHRQAGFDTTVAE